MFLHLCVILFIWRRGERGVGFKAYITDHMAGGLAPQHALMMGEGAALGEGGSAFGGVCIQGEGALQLWSWADPPRGMDAMGVRSTRGRYASYWNAFLFTSFRFYEDQ